MPRKKSKNDNNDGVPDIENLIKLIAKTLKDNMDSEDMNNIAKEFGINIKLSTNGMDLKPMPPGPNHIAKDFKPVQPIQPPQLPPVQPSEPFVETIYKKDSVVVDASMPNAKKEEINVIASQGILIIEMNSKGMAFSKKIQLEANVDPEKATATYKNGVLEIVLPVVQVAYQKDFRLSIK
ncbi:MAG: Hsp20/alpha crystallin family protein [Candidatus Marsarchaeota archaeon]|jgi:HSP20 family molecular chaperone IbpA|nr:Hsp20/alpha crystallin family protein [Candidatus Marsarchaeota archaeon]